MPPTARMRASTIRSDSVSVVLPRLKNRQDHLFLGATSTNGNLCTLRPLRLPFCQPAGQCLVSSMSEVATNRPEPGKDPNIVWMSDSDHRGTKEVPAPRHSLEQLLTAILQCAT